MKIIMLGAPGAGKGTYAKQITQKYGIPAISTGDIFRENIKAGTELGKKAKGYMDAGNLVPDELVCDLVVDRLKQDDCKKALKKQDDGIDFALEINMADEAIIERMAGRRVCKGCGATYHVVNIPPKKEGICDECGGEIVLRDDDAPETVKKRLEVYHEQTAPLIEYYDKLGLLNVIDGSKGLEACMADIYAVLESK